MSEAEPPSRGVRALASSAVAILFIGLLLPLALFGISALVMFGLVVVSARHDVAAEPMAVGAGLASGVLLILLIEAGLFIGWVRKAPAGKPLIAAGALGGLACVALTLTSVSGPLVATAGATWTVSLLAHLALWSAIALALALNRVTSRSSLAAGFAIAAGLGTAAMWIPIAGVAAAFADVANERAREAFTAQSLEPGGPTISALASGRNPAAKPQTANARWTADCFEKFATTPDLREHGKAIAARILSNGFIADDVVSAVIVSVCTRPEPPRNLRSFFLGAVEKRAKTDRRNWSRRESCPGDPGLLPVCHVNPEDDVLSAEEVTIAQTITCELDEDELRLLDLRLEGLAWEQIAYQLGITSAAARKQWSRLHPYLRDRAQTLCSRP